MFRRTLVAFALIGLGWAAARAQTRPTPDFELAVTTTQDGNATIECVRGCGLQWIERMVPDRGDAQKSFTYGCRNAWDKWPSGCPSGRLGGWITK